MWLSFSSAWGIFAPRGFAQTQGHTIWSSREYLCESSVDFIWPVKTNIKHKTDSTYIYHLFPTPGETQLLYKTLKWFNKDGTTCGLWALLHHSDLRRIPICTIKGKFFSKHKETQTYLVKCTELIQLCLIWCIGLWSKRLQDEQTCTRDSEAWEWNMALQVWTQWSFAPSALHCREK